MKQLLLDIIHYHQYCMLYFQELLMSGLPDIDVEDWERNTEYTGYDEDSDIVKVVLDDFLIVYITHDYCDWISFSSGSGS